MKHILTSIILSVILGMLILWLAGCSSGGAVTYLQPASVGIEKLPTHDVVVSKAEAFTDGQGLLISGKVKRTAGKG